MASKRYPAKLTTIDSIRLAAQENNAAPRGANKKKRKSLLMMLEQKTNALTKQDNRRWRQAWQMAINVENPKRLALYAIYRDTMVDLHLSGCFSQRFHKTLLKSFVIVDEQGNEDPEALRIFESKWFYHFLLRALDSIAWGHSLIQLGDVVTDANGVMKFDDVQLVPREHVMPEFGLLLREPNDSPDQGISYREGDLANWCVEVGDPYDLGLLLKCATHAIAKKNVTVFWDVFSEIFGMPLRIATTTSQNPADRKQIETMLEEMGAAGWGLFQDGTTVQFLESSRGDAYNVYDKRIALANSEMSKGVLGQTMTIDNGSSLSQANVHWDVLESIAMADAQLMEFLINDDLIPKMIRLGFPLKNRTFRWVDADLLSHTEQRELERMLLEFFELDPHYFVEKYKIPITGVKQQGGSFFE